MRRACWLQRGLGVIRRGVVVNARAVRLFREVSVKSNAFSSTVRTIPRRAGDHDEGLVTTGSADPPYSSILDNKTRQQRFIFLCCCKITTSSELVFSVTFMDRGWVVNRFSITSEQAFLVATCGLWSSVAR
jgi:hypothetical protein